MLKVTFQGLIEAYIIKKSIMSLEIRPLAPLYPHPHISLEGCDFELRSLSVVARGGMLLPTAFASLSIVSDLRKYMGGGYSAAKGLISRDIAKKICIQ